MHLTHAELTAIPSAVAAIAIVAGYLGVRSANKTAVKIARQERSAQRKDDFDSLRRKTYAEGLTALSTASKIMLLEDARKEVPQINEIERMLNLVAPENINEQFNSVIDCTEKNLKFGFEFGIRSLTQMMRTDLEGRNP